VCAVLDEVDLRKLKDLHSQLGCVNYDVCRQLLGLPRSTKEDENPFCEWCVLAKQRRTVYPKELEAATRAVFPIYRLFADFSRIKRPSLAGYQYFPLIVDDDSAYDGVKRKIVLKGVFGRLCFAKVCVRRKAEPKSQRCVFLGYSTKCKAGIVREVGSFSKSLKLVANLSKSLKEFYARDHVIVDFNVDVFPYRNSEVGGGFKVMLIQ
jgi:hypothetical protein